MLLRRLPLQKQEIFAPATGTSGTAGLRSNDPCVVINMGKQVGVYHFVLLGRSDLGSGWQLCGAAASIFLAIAS